MSLSLLFPENVESQFQVVQFPKCVFRVTNAGNVGAKYSITFSKLTKLR